MNSPNASSPGVLRPERPGFVSPQWLEEHLGDEDVRVLDVRTVVPTAPKSGLRVRSSSVLPGDKPEAPPRFVELAPGGGFVRLGGPTHSWGRAQRERRPTDPAPYDREHIRGAIRLDVARRLFDDRGEPVCGPELAMAMSELGVGDDDLVILVDDGMPGAANAAAWLLRKYGHRDTLILAGGHPRWTAEGRPVTDVVPKRAFASFTARLR